MNVRTCALLAGLLVVAVLAIPLRGIAADPPAGPTRVYILNGFDPLRAGGVGRLADRLRGSGYPDTRVGGWYRARAFEREIRAAHAADPTARFAIIGYSAGAYPTRAMANRLVRDGVPVAVVGYVGGDYLRNDARSRVPGAGRVVNVTGDGYLLTGRNLLFNGTDLPGAQNLRLSGTSHFGLPTHPDTFDTLYAALHNGN
jgi:hypothetical protein